MRHCCIESNNPDLVVEIQRGWDEKLGSRGLPGKGCGNSDCDCYVSGDTVTRGGAVTRACNSEAKHQQSDSHHSNRRISTVHAFSAIAQ